MGNVVIKRVYEAAESDDGYRVLVDRIWPRGIKKDDAELDLWFKEAGPSDELRKQFGHVARKFPAFAKTYRKELDGSEALEKLLSLARDKERLCLLYGAKDEEHNQAVVLRSVIGDQLGTGRA